MGEKPTCALCANADDMGNPDTLQCLDCARYTGDYEHDSDEYEPRPEVDADFKKAVRKKFGKPIDWSEVPVEEVEKR